MTEADVVVVGAGIVGASVAYHLARLGAVVTLVDRAEPGSGVTCRSFGWVGAYDGDGPIPAEQLRRGATEDYRRLEAELPGVAVRWSGSLTWPIGADGPRHLDHEHRDGALLDADGVVSLEPHLRRPPSSALHLAGDGAVDPVAVTEALVDGARRHGARVLTGTTVTSLAVGGGTVTGVTTSAGPLAADTVVLAAGADVPTLTAPLGVDVPVGPSPAILVRFAGPSDLVRTIVSSPDVEVRQAADGTLLAAVDHRGETTRADLLDTARRTLAGLRATFRGTDDVRVLDVRIGWRPMPVDDEPIVGPLPGLVGAYVTVMHAGVTLAPAVGRLVAAELVHGTQAPELRDCRPARFVTG